MKNFNWEDEAYSFLTALFRELEDEAVEIKPHWQIDHLCYRVESESDYLDYKKYFLDHGTLLIESLVSGRLISTFKMLKPLKFKSWTIDVIELPAPKKGKDCLNGFEHIEVVCDLSFDQLRNDLKNKTLDTKGLGKTFNPELELCLKNGAIKFHHQSLEAVVTLEKSSVFKVIEKSKIMEELKEYCPIIVGTFPLAIDVKNSDVDIVIHANNLENLIEKRPDFKLGNKFATLNFTFDGVEFEVYAEEKLSVAQNGYQHFHLEDRLLKLGSHKFRAKIIKLREQGLKTEDAFCQALALETTNPFLELLKYYYKSEEELKELIDASYS